METRRMPALNPRLEPAHDEEVAMHQFVQKCGKQEAPVVLWVLENWFREHDERLDAIAISAVAQSRGADELSLVAFFRGPIPLHASGEGAAEEDGVGGGDDAGEGLVVDLAIVEGVV